MNTNKIDKIKARVTIPLDKVLSLSVFDEPRPKYISKITIFDKFFRFTILRFFPRFIRPNFLTVFRFVSIPFIIILLLNNNFLSGFWLFIISALSDALDGAMARTRNQITDWGIVFDPVADKILIGSVSVILIARFISPLLAGLIVVLEILMIVSAYWRYKGKIVPAKVAAKIKMILQCLGVAILLLALVWNSPILISLATYTLILSVIFSLLSLIVYRSI